MSIHRAKQQQPSVPTKQSNFKMRPIELPDADAIADWFQQIEDVSIFDRQLPLPVNHVEVTALVKSWVEDQKKARCRWFIAQSEDGEMAGMTGLESINLLHGHALLPVFVAESWRRSGIGIRMACMMIDVAFKQLRLNRVATVYRADNAASGALLERLGFSSEGVSRQSWFSQGQYFDLMNAGLLVNEWNEHRTKLQTELSPTITVELGPRPSSSWCWPEHS